MNKYGPVTEELRSSPEFTKLMWKNARILNLKFNFGVEKCYEILETVQPDHASTHKGKLVSIHFYKPRLSVAIRKAKDKAERLA